MDPISQAVAEFQASFRKFRSEGRKRVLLMVSEAADRQTLAKVLRAEEWRADNTSPFLIFSTPYRDRSETFADMCSTIVMHYAMLRKELVEQGVTLPPWPSRAADPEDPAGRFALYVRTFQQGLRPPLEEVIVCWLPTEIADAEGWLRDVLTIHDCLATALVRFVLSDAKGGPLEKRPAR